MLALVQLVMWIMGRPLSLQQLLKVGAVITCLALWLAIYQTKINCHVTEDIFLVFLKSERILHVIYYIACLIDGN